MKRVEGIKKLGIRIVGQNGYFDCAMDNISIRGAKLKCYRDMSQW